jgi:hypothetical protein
MKQMQNRLPFVTVEAFRLASEKRLGVFRTLPKNRFSENALVLTDLDGSVFKRLFADQALSPCVDPKGRFATCYAVR